MRASRGGLAAVTQRRRRGAPLKRTPALRRKAFQLFEQGLKIPAAHRVLSKRVSIESWTVRSSRVRRRRELMTCGLGTGGGCVGADSGSDNVQDQTVQV